MHHLSLQAVIYFQVPRGIFKESIYSENFDVSKLRHYIG